MKAANIILGLNIVMILTVIGCNWDPPQQEESMPVTEDEIVGYWLYKNKEGVCLLDIRKDGRYRQVCSMNNQDAPFYDSGWQAWTFHKEIKSQTTPSISFNKMLNVSSGIARDEFENTEDVKKYDIYGVTLNVFKYDDGQVVLHSGIVDLKKDRPWGDWDRITSDQLPSFYKVGAVMNDK